MNELLAYYSEMVPMFMTVASLSIVAAEWVALSILSKVERHKEGIVNVLSASLNFLPLFVLNKVVIASIMFWVYQYRLFDLGLEWYVWVLAYIGYDFMSYALHWMSHKVRFYWCIHSVHHSPKEMKASVSFRGSFFEFLLSPHLILWLPILGFHPLMVIIVEGVALLYGVPLHLSEHFAPKKEPSWLKKIIITPLAHRLHHGSNAIYLDTNYGLTFSIWDFLFKTYQHVVPSEKPIYGLQKEIDSENLLVTQTDEFLSLWKDMKSAPRWQDKLKYLVMPPGWNHLDGGKTARQIRREALKAGKEEVIPSRVPSRAGPRAGTRSHDGKLENEPQA